MVKQIQDRTSPSITLKVHKLKTKQTDLLVLEIPFSKQLHRTSKSEYLIRSNDGNRAIEPHELNTIQAEKELIVYDQKYGISITNLPKMIHKAILYLVGRILIKQEICIIV